MVPVISISGACSRIHAKTRNRPRGHRFMIRSCSNFSTLAIGQWPSVYGVFLSHIWLSRSWAQHRCCGSKEAFKYDHFTNLAQIGYCPCSTTYQPRTGSRHRHQKRYVMKYHRTSHFPSHRTPHLAAEAIIRHLPVMVRQKALPRDASNEDSAERQFVYSRAPQNPQ